VHQLSVNVKYLASQYAWHPKFASKGIMVRNDELCQSGALIRRDVKIFRLALSPHRLYVIA
jgi:hypothetical protein